MSQADNAIALVGFLLLLLFLHGCWSASKELTLAEQAAKDRKRLKQAQEAGERGRIVTGEELRAAQASVSYSDEQMAEALGVTPACFKGWKLGERMIPTYLEAQLMLLVEKHRLELALEVALRVAAN